MTTHRNGGGLQRNKNITSKHYQQCHAFWFFGGDQVTTTTTTTSTDTNSTTSNNNNTNDLNTTNTAHNTNNNSASTTLFSSNSNTYNLSSNFSSGLHTSGSDYEFQQYKTDTTTTTNNNSINVEEMMDDDVCAVDDCPPFPDKLKWIVKFADHVKGSEFWEQWWKYQGIK